MGHIHKGDGEYDFTASAFIVRVDTPEPQLLLHQHKILGKLLQIGGHVELNENPWQAVLREVPEESGYDLTQLHVLQPPLRLRSLSGVLLLPQPININDHLFNFSGTHRHTDIAFGFTADGEPTHMPDDGESLDLRWKSLTELRALSDDEIIRNVREIGEFALTTILTQYEPVRLDEFEA